MLHDFLPGLLLRLSRVGELSLRMYGAGARLARSTLPNTFAGSASPGQSAGWFRQIPSQPFGMGMEEQWILR